MRRVGRYRHRGKRIGLIWRGEGRRIRERVPWWLKGAMETGSRGEPMEWRLT